MSANGISLSRAELETIENLRRQLGGCPGHFLANLEELFRQTRILLGKIGDVFDSRGHGSCYALIGTIHRTHQLLVSGIQQITRNLSLHPRCSSGLSTDQAQQAMEALTDTCRLIHEDIRSFLDA